MGIFCDPDDFFYGYFALSLNFYVYIYHAISISEKAKTVQVEALETKTASLFHFFE